MSLPVSPAADAAPAAQRFTCAQCGAGLHYAPGTVALRCGHCGYENRITISPAPVVEMDFHQALRELAAHRIMQDNITHHCDSCGAEYTFDAAVHADSCPFCGGSVVEQTGHHRQLQPQALLPFNIAVAQARSSFRRWLRHLWFAPGKLKRYGRDDSKLTGMYVPYWTYDAATTTTYQGARGDYYQVPEDYQTVENGQVVIRTRRVTKIRWTPTAGTVSRHFDDVLVLASQSLPRQVTERLEPWDLHNLQPYQEQYLSGFRSEMYQIDLAKGFDYAREIMARMIAADVTGAIGGDQQRISQLETRFGAVTCKHILLPIWISTLLFRNKSYRFVVNGRSGETQGERPYSPWKIAFAALLLAAAAGLAIWLTSQGEMVQHYRY